MNALSLFDVLILVGISQGIFSALLLSTHRPFRTSKVILASVQLTFVLLSVKILLHTLGLWQNPSLTYFPLAIDLALQPLIYLYVRSATDRSFTLTPRSLLHFVPATVFMIHAIGVYTATLSTSNIFEKDSIASQWSYNFVKNVEDFLSVISLWAYVVISQRQLATYRKWLSDNNADSSISMLSWLQNVLWVFGLLALILTINLTVDGLAFMTDRFFHWQLFYLAIAAAVYYLGVAGYRQEPPQISILKESTMSGGPKSAFSDRSLKEAKEKINKAMEEAEAFRDPEITLAKLAELTNLSQAVVSGVINKEYGQNFRTFINARRIRDVKLRLRDPRSAHFSILGIALESGFNSEASFYRIFKQMVGKSPKEFLDENRNEHE